MSAAEDFRTTLRQERMLMSNLIVVAYDDQFEAEEVRTKLRKL
jgi:hypothetical protein